MREPGPIFGPIVGEGNIQPQDVVPPRHGAC